jgi:hypothetical protein
LRNARLQQLFALIAGALSSTCDPMGRTGLPTDGTGGAPAIGTTTVSQSVTASTSTSTNTSTSSSTTSSTITSGPGGGVPTPRRPFLVGAHLRTAKVTSRSDWQTSLTEAVALPLDEVTRSMLAKAWLEDAREEHASIAAFARWSLLMLSVGAPPDLVRDSQRASLDEIRHATDCFSLARRYGAGDVGPAPLDLTDSLTTLSLLEMSQLAAHEGCVGETLGAAVAIEQLRWCEDPIALPILRRLVADEERHAKLAWSFLAWAVSVGGSDLLSAVTTTIERASVAALETPIRTYHGVDIAAWHRHGRVTCEEARRVVDEATQLVVMPAVMLLRPNCC